MILIQVVTSVRVVVLGIAIMVLGVCGCRMCAPVSVRSALVIAALSVVTSVPFVPGRMLRSLVRLVVFLVRLLVLYPCNFWVMRRSRNGQ